MLKLKINRDDLIQALTFRFEITDGTWYLDKETGDVLLQAEGAEDLPEDLEENPRYLPIDPIESRVGYRIMEDFVATVADARMAGRLQGALEGPKPFRRFKDALLQAETLREAWFEFENSAHQEIARQWCAENDIEPEWT